MDEKEYEPPITISGRAGGIRIAYDQITVDVPAGCQVPEDAPALARRIFAAFTCDLPGDLRAE